MSSFLSGNRIFSEIRVFKMWNHLESCESKVLRGMERVGSSADHAVQCGKEGHSFLIVESTVQVERCHQTDEGTGLSLAVLLSNGVGKMPYEIVA